MGVTMNTTFGKTLIAVLLWSVLVPAVFPPTSRSQCADAPDITGTWEWERTSGSIAGLTWTPASAGCTRQVVFSPDNTMRWYQNEILQENVPLELTCEEIGQDVWNWRFFADSLFFMQNPNHPKRIVIVGTGPDRELVLHDDCWDCYTYRLRSRAPILGHNGDTSWGALKMLYR